MHTVPAEKKTKQPTVQLTREEKEFLAELFERYRMRLWSMLRRKIGPSLEAKFDIDDVLSEAYMRAEKRWFARPEDPEKYYVFLYGVVHEQFVEMVRRESGVTRGGHVDHASLFNSCSLEIAEALWKSQTGASTIVTRKEFLSRLQSLLERSLEQAEMEIFTMRVLDRFEFQEIARELVRRSEEESEQAADYKKILTELDSRSGKGDRDAVDANKRRAEAIRKRFKRALGRVTSAVLSEFPELLDALPRLARVNS